jgi:hypothetical protein
MNNLAILPYIAMYTLQIQNVKRDVAKKININKLNDSQINNIHKEKLDTNANANANINANINTNANTNANANTNIDIEKNNLSEPEPNGLNSQINTNIGAEINI